MNNLWFRISADDAEGVVTILRVDKIEKAFYKEEVLTLVLQDSKYEIHAPSPLETFSKITESNGKILFAKGEVGIDKVVRDRPGSLGF